MNKKIFFLFVVTFLLMSPFLNLAYGIGHPEPAIVNLPGGLNFGNIINNLKETILTMLWSISLTFVIVMFSLAGYKYLTAQGEPAKIDDANKALIWGVFGAVVIVLAWSILEIVRLQLGV